MNHVMHVSPANTVNLHSPPQKARNFLPSEESPDHRIDQIKICITRILQFPRIFKLSFLKYFVYFVGSFLRKCVQFSCCL